MRLVVRVTEMTILAAASAILAAFGIAHAIIPVPGGAFLSILFLGVAAFGFWTVEQMWQDVMAEINQLDPYATWFTY